MIPGRSTGRSGGRSRFRSRVGVAERSFTGSGLGLEFSREIQDAEVLHALKILFDPLFSALFVERGLWVSLDLWWIIRV